MRLVIWMGAAYEGKRLPYNIVDIDYLGWLIN
jgi:hypothetical protein